MSRQRTSRAKIYSARLNPVNPAEAAVIAEIDKWEQQGVNFKQLVVDRIIRGADVPPQIYPDGERASVEALRPIFEQFADFIIGEMRRAGRFVGGAPETEQAAESTEFSRRFVHSFQARRKAVLGEDDDE